MKKFERAELPRKTSKPHRLLDTVVPYVFLSDFSCIYKHVRHTSVFIYKLTCCILICGLLINFCGFENLAMSYINGQ